MSTQRIRFDCSKLPAVRSKGKSLRALDHEKMSTDNDVFKRYAELLREFRELEARMRVIDEELVRIERELPEAKLPSDVIVDIVPPAAGKTNDTRH